MLNDTYFVPSLDIFSLGISFYEMICISIQIDMKQKQQQLKHQQQVQQQVEEAEVERPMVMFSLPDNGPIWHDLRNEQHHHHQ